MLAGLRRIVRSPIVLIIIIAPLIVGFAIFGVSDVFTRTADAVVVVGPEKVSQRELARAFSQRLRREQQDDPTLTAESARSQGLGDTVLEELIITAQIRAQAHELNLTVSNEQIAEEIQAFEIFVDPVTGGLDRQAYNSFLQTQNMTPDQFEEGIGQDMLRGQLVNALFAGVRTPEAYGTILQGFQNERRSMRALVIPPEAAGDIGDPDDEALQGIIDNFPQYFTIPERRAFTLARFRVDDFKTDVEIDEADLREQYDYEIDTNQIGVPATRSYTQIRFEAGDAANQASTRIRAGEDAASVSSELGGDAPFSLVDRQAYQVPDEALADAIFAASEGETLAVEGRLGWFVVHIDAAQEATIPDFETRRAEIFDLLAADAAADAMFEAISAFEVAINAGATLEEAAQEAGIPYEVFGLIGSDNRNEDGDFAFSFFEQPEITSAVFEQIEGLTTDLVPYGEGDYFAVRVDDISASSVRDLEDARESATVFWRLQTVYERLETITEDAHERIESGESLDSVAASITGARVESAALRRGETAAPFDQTAVGTAFILDVGESAIPIHEFRPTSAISRSHMVVIVDEVYADQSNSPEALFELRSFLAQQLQSDIDRGLVAAMAAKYPRRVDYTLRDQALGVLDPSLIR